MQLVIENQAKDTLDIEKRSIEKTLREMTEKNLNLKAQIEKYTIIENELEFTKHKYEEKYTEYLLATQEIDNLTESTEYLKSEIIQLNSDLVEKKNKIFELEHHVLSLQAQESEQAAMIIALQDPTGNKTLALALSESEHYKQKNSELDLELLGLKKNNSELFSQVLALKKQNEEISIDLNASKATLIELKDILAGVKKTNIDLRETEQNLLDEVEGLKEILEREKHHSDILRERMMNKHNEALTKLVYEKTELVKEIDIMKNTIVKLEFCISEFKIKNNQLVEKSAAEIRANERATNELIDCNVANEKLRREIVEEKKISKELKNLFDLKENEFKNTLQVVEHESFGLQEKIKVLENENLRILELITNKERENKNTHSQMMNAMKNLENLKAETGKNELLALEINEKDKKIAELNRKVLETTQKLNFESEKAIKAQVDVDQIV